MKPKADRYLLVFDGLAEDLKGARIELRKFVEQRVTEVICAHVTNSTW